MEKIENTDFMYKMKCRCCGKIVEIYFGNSAHVNEKTFKIWISEHSDLGATYRCECDTESTTFYDLISFKGLLKNNL